MVAPVCFLGLAPLVSRVESLYSARGAPGAPLQQGLRAMIVQFLEDYSDRQMEPAIAENIAVKWFCQFELGETTPDHSAWLSRRCDIEAEHERQGPLSGQMVDAGSNAVWVGIFKNAETGAGSWLGKGSTGGGVLEAIAHNLQCWLGWLRRNPELAI